MKTDFKFFDPTEKTNRLWRYSQKAQNIFWRAKSLVCDRSTEEMSTILQDARVLLEMYFEDELNDAIQLIRKEGRDDLIETDESGNFKKFRDEAYDACYVRDKETISKLDALKEALERHFDPKAVDVENVHPFEYFGCLALIRFDEFVGLCDFKYRIDTFKYEKKPISEATAEDRVQMAEILLDALDCVSRGEAEKIRNNIKKTIEKNYVENSQIGKMRAEILQSLKADEEERRKQRLDDLRDRRHASNRQIKARALAWFERKRGEFRSAAQAAKAYCEELSKQGIPREQSVVVGWFRAHAKEKKIRLKP